jgi:predicted nucleic acid-binding protein
MIMSRSVTIVLDTHVFLRGIAGSAQDTNSTVYEVMINKCSRLAVNEPIIDEYTDISPRHGLSPLFVSDALSELKALGKLQRAGRYAGRYGGKRPILVGPKQDRPFIEAAIAMQAKYVVTRDPDFAAFAGIAKRRRFSIVTPEEYLRREN